jgi:hypothetical protein
MLIEKAAWSYETGCAKIRFYFFSSMSAGSGSIFPALLGYFIHLTALAIDKVSHVADDQSCCGKGSRLAEVAAAGVWCPDKERVFVDTNNIYYQKLI